MTEGNDEQLASAPVHAFVHTPGPWKVRARFDVVQDLGIYGGYFVGSTRGNSSDLPSNVQAQDEANARLIAAAPELYQALKSALAIVSIWGPVDDVASGHEGEMQALTAMQMTFEELVNRVEGVV
jgi:hypothetical protein